METLAELISACRAADTEQITERKKQIEKIKILLKKSEITEGLDHCSKVKQKNPEKRLFGWNSLFKVVKNLLWRETAALQKAKNIQSSSSIKKKEEICSLIKMVIRLANKSGPYLNGSDVVNHIVGVMKNDFTCVTFGNTHTNILLRDVLSVRTYWRQLETKTWHELLSVYCQHLLEPLPGVSSSVVTQVIQGILLAATQQCDVRVNKVLLMFEAFFQKIKQEQSLPVIESLLSALNAICYARADDYRYRICQFGESIFVQLLYLWKKQRSDRIKDQLIKFFQLQMMCHHPCGAKHLEQGAMAADEELWKSHLRKLYEAVCVDLQVIKDRAKYAKRDLDQCLLKDNYLSLATDVFYQMFTEGTAIVEVTQELFLQSQPRSPAKKRRLESHWGILQQVIEENGATHASLPWIQLLTAITEKYPSSIPNEEFHSVLITVQSVYADCKKIQVTNWLLKCLDAMAKAQVASDRNMETFVQESCRNIWQKCWLTSLRIINLHHAEDKAFYFLSTLLSLHLVTPDKDMWNLFLPIHSQPTDGAIQFLSTYLKLYDLPEQFRPPSLLTDTCVSEHSLYPLRQQLLGWLLCSEDSDLDSIPTKMNLTKIRPDALAEVLVALTLRDTQAIHGLVSKQLIPVGIKPELSSIETDYLITSFDDEQRINADGSVLAGASEPSPVLSLKSCLTEALSTETKHLLAATEPDIRLLELMLHRACLLADILVTSIHNRLLTLDGAMESVFYSHLKKMLSKFTEHLSRCLRKETKITSMLSDLRQLFSRCSIPELGVSFCDSNRHTIENLIRSTFPAELIRCLLDFVMQKVKKRKLLSTSGYADFEADFDFMNAGSTSQNDDDFDQIEASFREEPGSESQGSQNSSTNTASESLFSTCLLSDSDQQLLLVVDALISFASDKNNLEMTNNNPDTIQINFSPADVSRKLVCLIDLKDDYWDVNKPASLQLLDHLVCGLCNSEHQVTDDEMDAFIETISEVCIVHKKDQDICCVVLKMIRHILSQLDDSMGMISVARRQARDVILYLLHVFWKQIFKGRYYYKTRLVLADCIKTVVRCDPEGYWAVWNKDDPDDDKALFLSEAFVDMLADCSHPVRLHVAKYIECVFCSYVPNGTQPLASAHQDKMFERICTVIRSTVTEEEQKEQIDEITNRTSAILLALVNVASVSLRCEKKALFVICQMTRERSLNVTLVQKVLGKVANHLGYKSLQKYMRNHIPYILCHWFESGYSLDDFPYQLSCFKTQNDFYRAFKSTIIPLLVMGKDRSSLESLGDHLSSNWCELVKAAIPDILVHILPLFAANKLNELKARKSIQARIVHANSCYEFLAQIVHQEVIEQSIVNNFEMIVVKVLMTLSDLEPNPGQQKSVIESSEPNPPSFSSVIVKATLNYLREGHTTRPKSLVSLLAESQDHIEKVLLSLTIHMSNSHRPSDRYRVLVIYDLFVRMLLCEFPEDLGASWLYVLRQVVFVLLHHLQQLYTQSSRPDGQQAALILLVLSLLSDVIQAAIQNHVQELSHYLPVIISNVLPFAELDGEIKEKIHQIINKLITEDHDELKTAIALNGPLPDVPAFHSANEIQAKLKYENGPLSLKQEIEYFLQATGQEHIDSMLRKQRLLLNFLYSKLHRDKSELAQLVKDTQDQLGNSVLVRLIYSLFRMSRSTDPEEASTAAKCLGEIGPIPLPVTAVMDEESHSGTLHSALKNFSESKLLQYCWIFHKLCEYLVDSSIDTVVAASSVLKCVLATKTGTAFYKQYQIKVQDKLFHYLRPYQSGKRKMAPSLLGMGSDSKFSQLLDVDELWLPLHQNHDQWIGNLVTAIIDSRSLSDEILVLLGPVCQAKTEFCELILPYLIHDILTRGNATFDDILAKHFNNFFRHHSTHFDKKGGSTSDDITYNLKSVQTMLNVILYLRLQPRPSRGRQVQVAWDNNFWLDVDYLYIAKAAYNCASYFTALLLAEIWCNVQRENLHLTKDTQILSDQSHSDVLDNAGNHYSQDAVDFSSHGFMQSNPLELLASFQKVDDIKIQFLMLEIYRSIGDPDALHGCGAGHLSDATTRIVTYEHENSWYKALGCYDLQMTERTQKMDPLTQLGLLKTLQNCGCSHVLDVYLKALPDQWLDQNACLQDLQYEAAWRNGVWNLDTPARLDQSCSYNQAFYVALKSLRDNDITMVTKALSIARLQSLSEISSSGMKCVHRIYPVLCKLHSLTQIEDMLNCINSDIGPDQLLERWNCQTAMLPNDFTFLEPILLQRSILLQTLCERNQQSVSDTLMTTLESLSKCARESGRTQLAERYVHQLKRMDASCEELRSCTWKMEEASVFWCRGETDTAKHIMKSLIRKFELSQCDNKEATTLYAKCLGIYGNWLAETKSENPNVIMRQYLQKAKTLLTLLEVEDETALDAYLSLARFADAQHQNIVNHMKSMTFKDKQGLVRKAKDDAEHLRQLGENNSHYLRILEKQMLIDEAELKSLEEDKFHFLHCALVNYLKCLQTGDRHDLRVFRMTSLWFDNCKDATINNLLKTHLPKIMSHKFLPLMYQLAARMTTRTDAHSFQETLNTLIERTVRDHPHHTLFIILALAHANKDSEMMSNNEKSKKLANSRNSNSSEGQKDNREQDHVSAAQNMLKKLSKSNRSEIVRDMKILSLSYIQMANWNVDKYKKITSPIAIPSVLKLTQLENLAKVALPTLDVKVDPSCQYNDIVYVVKFLPTFKLAGGVNLPKIIDCLGSDGVTRRQLVKGRDDLRQDAVMQQVFAMVNNLLQKDESTSRRKLKVRTYKVIPLSQRSGVLEWCEGTVPMGQYLVAPSTGAHERYRPRDWKAMQCRETMVRGCQQASHQKKYETFLKICQNFKPVFRHFFMESFPDPADWYQCRLAYTHSVSTNSIVGYILGLGDRHVQNILIDTRTAEIIHIDLGVAFEQGRILPTPETVPFRLTRDVVDGMGITGVEGVFRRCCEKTLEVMRGSHEAVITILQVLLYDPLYAWTLSPEKAYHLQHRHDLKADDRTSVSASSVVDVKDFTGHSSKTSESSENLNTVAERVLLRLQQKLQGVEEGVPLSISGQVNLLIQQATDPKNLCCLYPGWQPYI